MKNIIIFLLLFFATINVGAQEFVASTHKNNTQYTDTTTTYTYRCSEKVYDVYVSRNGAYYIWKISKRTNKLYKYYLPKEIQIKMGRKY